MLRERTPPDERKLLAFHYSEGWTQQTWTGEQTQAPDLIHEVTETIREDGSRLYEGWIYEARSRKLILGSPYQSTFAQAFVDWWIRETETEPPEELLPRRGHAHHDTACTADEPRRD